MSFFNCHTWINRKEKVGSNSISAWQIPKIGTISEENTPPTPNHHVQKRMWNIILGKEFVINRRDLHSHGPTWACMQCLSCWHYFFNISLHAGRAICCPFTHTFTNVNSLTSIRGAFLHRCIHNNTRCYWKNVSPKLQYQQVPQNKQSCCFAECRWI